MKKILPIVLLGSMISTTQQTQCLALRDVTDFFKKPMAMIATTILGSAIFRFYMKRPCADPSRFETEKLKEASQKKDFKKIISQLLYFIDDVIIGRRGRGSTVKVMPDGKTLDIGAAYDEMGLGGKIHSYFIPISKTLAFMLALRKFLEKAEDGIDAWRYYMGYDEDAII